MRRDKRERDRWGETFSDDVVAAAMIDRSAHRSEVPTLPDHSYRPGHFLPGSPRWGAPDQEVGNATAMAFSRTRASKS